MKLLKTPGIVATLLFSWACAYLGFNVFQQYAFGLFIWLPIVMGAVTTIVLGYKGNTSRKQLFKYCFLVLIIFCFGLLAFAFEGIICIIMAMPIGMLFTYIGHRIGYVVLQRKSKVNIPATIILFLLSTPLVMSFEYKKGNSSPLRKVTTSIEIAAPATSVWRNVIAFPKLQPPSEFIFKTGIAFPIDAEIEGRGVDAIRHCNFSTGSFVEPITIWNEPHLLQFSVTEQPVPMSELSPYDIHPTHLHGYWVSKKGQFKLSALPNGHTLLEGTTWYENKIKPTIYWTLWSDYIIHSIHNRVLSHIKDRSELN